MSPGDGANNPVGRQILEVKRVKLKFNTKKDLLHLFSTPIGIFSLEDTQNYTPRIAEAILAREANEEGIERSNKGGWHSDLTIMDWPELGFVDLRSLFLNAVSKMIAVTSEHKKFKADIQLEAWANINRAGSFNSSHVHPENHWSGVFYVKTTDFSDDPVRRAGCIELHDPRGPIQMLISPSRQPDKVSFKPVEGNILLFPAWLYHSVNTFSLDTTRISIAFNARIEHFKAAETK